MSAWRADAYRAAILSLLGGVTWGLTLAREGLLDQPGVRVPVVRNVASPVAFGATLLHAAFDLRLLMSAFTAMMIYDLGNTARGLELDWLSSTGPDGIFIAKRVLALAGSAELVWVSEPTARS
jgi:hypothetical protein